MEKSIESWRFVSSTKGSSCASQLTNPGPQDDPCDAAAVVVTGSRFDASWCVGIPRPICGRLLAHCMRRAYSRDACTAGSRRPIRVAMIAITTSNSTSVKAASRRKPRVEIIRKAPDASGGGPSRATRTSCKPESLGHQRSTHATRTPAETQTVCIKTLRHRGLYATVLQQEWKYGRVIAHGVSLPPCPSGARSCPCSPTTWKSIFSISS